MRSLYPWPIFPSDLSQTAAFSLSLQLALKEWLASFDIITTLLSQPPENLEGVSSELQKFLLFSIDNPFSRKAGTLDKLCYFSDELLARTKVDLREPIETLLDNMRDAILDFRSKSTSWKRKMPPIFMIASEIKLLSSTLTMRLGEFFEALIPFFEEAKSDENILFYLIENRAAINKVLFPKKVEDLFSHLYPAGPEHLRAIICEGYTRRGFADFYKKHETLIDSIDWACT
jgi:hypothetical protein